MIKKMIIIVIIAMMYLMVLPEPVSAEHEWDHRYTLNGELTNLDGGVARGSKVIIDCSEGMTDPDLCGHNDLRSDSSSFSGRYSLILHIHSTDHGKNVTIAVEGETFNHTIDLKGADGEMEEGDRLAIQDIQLSKNVSSFGFFMPYIVIGTLVSTVVLMVFKKKGIWIFKQKDTRTNSRGQNSSHVNCPKCDVKINSINLERHLKSVHSMKNEDISTLLGKNDNNAK